MAGIKQVILIRRDLKMRRGKEIAQGSHASSEFLVRKLRGAAPGAPVLIQLRRPEQEWLQGGMAKVCLKVPSEEELLACHRQALDQGLTSHLIRDSGKTEFGGEPTLTACAIGPDEAARIDRITGHLSLY